MKRHVPHDHGQRGFIPLLISVFLLVAILAYLVYLRVAHAHHATTGMNLLEFF
jgi:hypothetical protein